MCHNTGCKLQTQHLQYQQQQQQQHCLLCPSSVSVSVGLMLASLCQLSASSHEAADMQQGSWFTQDSGQLHHSKRGYSHHVGLIKPHEQPGVIQQDSDSLIRLVEHPFNIWGISQFKPMKEHDLFLFLTIFTKKSTTCVLMSVHFSRWSCSSTILI